MVRHFLHGRPLLFTRAQVSLEEDFCLMPWLLYLVLCVCIAAAQRTCFGHLPLATTRFACLSCPGLWQLVSSWRVPTPGHCTESGLRHTPESFCEVSLFAWPMVLAWEAGFGTCLVTYRGILREYRLWTPSMCSLSTLLWLAGMTQRTETEPRFLWLPPRGHLQIAVFSWAAWLILSITWDCIY